MDSPNQRARSFLAGEALSFVEADSLWRLLLDRGEPSLARSVPAGSAKAITTPQYCGTRYRPRARRVANCA